jgi:hypothetical protein
VTIVINITEAAIRKYIQKRQEEAKRRKELKLLLEVDGNTAWNTRLLAVASNQPCKG